ncbi:MAG: glycosyltransferase family 39 protein [Rhodobacteraceae bacterium]|nr:glycosyltransferase family 39 protein [Paracoccaceae bacterium]
MRQSAAPPAPEPVILGLAVIAVLALYRGGMLWVSTADLFMDESQYWLWGQALDWGYYSKPPMIGWVLRAFTELAGSDAIPIIRLPMVLFQTATAIIVLFAARQITDPVSATWCGVVYATCPFTAAGSFLVSTDTVLAPFFAMMLLLYLRLARRSSAMLALTLGFCMGLGMLAKYAAVYFVIGAVIGALLIPPARISPRDLALAAASLGITVAPNVLWNLQNDLTTLSHTVDNVDWIKDIGSDMSLNWAGPGAFLAGQFLVFGPIWFAAYPWAIWRALRGSDWRVKWLVCMSLPIIVLVCGQALLSKAYANWAVMAYLAALLLTVPFLWLYCVDLWGGQR